MTAKVFEAALGIGAPWSVGAVEFDEATKVLTVPVDFAGHEVQGIGPKGCIRFMTPWSRPTGT
ncbi:hypothetical protein MJJ08_13515 [Xanthomonas oryzae]|uniref:hypothetical protein n=1 Tax=Xanthomonas oryzae TaxID=347 RepID=UPI0023B0DC33|nr:hypothetical protein [Xanthomonas oryzae]WEE96412.1 hypothetical protein MJJ08_13515 [Xanthomonas oryzae]